MSDFVYVGSELDLFAAVVNWKAYWSSKVLPYVVGEVLEAGAGLGSNTRLLARGGSGRWLALEPDAKLTEQLAANLAELQPAGRFEWEIGTLETLDASQKFDTILYIDVMEHIEHHEAEMQRAYDRLRPGGRVIVLSPAHQWLFTAFDESIGHFRRYTKKTLRAISPPGTKPEALFYLDACGIMASGANRLLLKQSMPTKEQLAVWDKYIVPVSRVLDPVLGYSIGKSIVGVWRKPV